MEGGLLDEVRSTGDRRIKKENDQAQRAEFFGSTKERSPTESIERDGPEMQRQRTGAANKSGWRQQAGPAERTGRLVES